MKRRQAKDAAVLGITAADLWPGPGWNFVFGQASLKERVGVWSMARNGDPDDRPAMRKICAMRTVMTATHETGHMFGIRHCIAYECGMNGSNHSDERDRQPLEFCPECQPKLWWTLELDPLERSRALEAVARRHGFDNVAGLVSRNRPPRSEPERDQERAGAAMAVLRFDVAEVHAERNRLCSSDASARLRRSCRSRAASRGDRRVNRRDRDRRTSVST